MIRRKLCAALVAAAVSVSALFAQTAKYTELLNKAKAYEDKKEWCYALGYYYDAMAEDPENAEEALARYTAIADAIKAGKPGLGDYNEFTLHDSWIPLLQNTEKYWTEFCPEYFTFSGIEKGAVDFKTRTASYSISITGHASAKYSEIQGLIEGGYQTAYRSDWTDMPEKWPSPSIFSSAAGPVQKGAALFISGDGVYPAWNYCDETGHGLYDLKFSICDENGKELLKSGRYLKGTKSYTFDKVPADIMAVIDAGKVQLKLTAIYLEYGTYNRADDDGGRGFVKHLQELPISLEQNEKNTINEDVIDNINKKVAQRKAEEEKAQKRLAAEKGRTEKEIAEREANEVFVEGNGEIKSFYMWKTEVTLAQYLYVSWKKLKDSGYNEYPVDEISWYDAVNYCNKRSEQEGLTPCYSGDGDSITCDFTANGYRLPTSAEWEYAAKGGKNERKFKYAGSNKINEVAWYKGNMYILPSINRVAGKKPNTLGIYDMSGNVSEWCWDWDASGSGRVYRGGDCFDDDDFCTVSFSNGYDPSHGLNGLGFRVVRSSSVK